MNPQNKEYLSPLQTIKECRDKLAQLFNNVNSKYLNDHAILYRLFDLDSAINRLTYALERPDQIKKLFKK